MQKTSIIFLRRIGLHPLSAFAAICVDLMLFGPETLAPPSVILTVIFGFLISVPVYLLQKYASNDSAKIALAKAMIIGILTAIPTPLPAFISGLGGILGIIGLSLTNPAGEKSVSPETKSNQKDDVIDIKAE